MTEHAPAVIGEAVESWGALSKSDRLAAFRALPREDADDFFLSLSGRDKAELMLSVSFGERRIWMRLLAPDDAADLIQQAPEEERASLLGMLDDSMQREVAALLAYQEDVAGGLMNPRFARLRPGMTADEAISYLRMQREQVPAIYYGYVLDNEQCLLGIVALRDLFTSEKNKRIREVMRTKFVSASEEMDQEALAALFAQHHLLAIPILDHESTRRALSANRVCPPDTEARRLARHPVSWRDVDRYGDGPLRRGDRSCGRIGAVCSVDHQQRRQLRLAGRDVGGSRPGRPRAAVARLVASCAAGIRGGLCLGAILRALQLLSSPRWST
jgi:hypothetical protein